MQNKRHISLDKQKRPSYSSATKKETSIHPKSLRADLIIGQKMDESSHEGALVSVMIELTHQKQELTAQLDALFHSRSIAIVGLPRGMKTGKLFLLALLDQGFSGKIYPVNPEAGEIDGLKAYPSVSAIPEPVDLAISLVSSEYAKPVVEECAAKGIKGVILFTAGYKETGTLEGKNLEQELVRIAGAKGMRLFGPNCMGVYCPETGLSFFPGLSHESGPVSFISHSGSLANILARMGGQKGIRFSKAVSLGNEADLCSADFLTYFGQDPQTGVIAGYLESIKEGRYFRQALEDASREKPVILWKVGLTPEGSRAASSHTGALSGSREIWEGIVRQAGAIPVTGFEALVDAMMSFALFPDGLGNRIAIISGPGGLAVSAAEACGYEGLRLAELSPKTQAELGEFVPPAGTSLRNPIDVGLSASLNLDLYFEAARCVAADPGVDAVLVIGAALDEEGNRRFTEKIIQIRGNSGKPFLMINIPGFNPELAATFCRSGIPFYDSAERAVHNYALVRRYQIRRKKLRPPLHLP
jgi:acyl-CoA synthetase (NDP forming)